MGEWRSIFHFYKGLVVYTLYCLVVFMFNEA